MPFTTEQAATISETLLATVEVFADTAPGLEDAEMLFGEVTEGEGPTVKMREVNIDGERFLIMAKRIGG